MNYNNLSARELIHYLDLYSEDPIVLRLVKLLKEESIVQELVDVGMNPDTMTFEADYQHVSPGEYIDQLRRDVDYYVEERDSLENEVDELRQEVKRMSTIGIMNFVADVHHKLEMATLEKNRATRAAEEERKRREEAEQKFEFWDKLHHGIK